MKLKKKRVILVVTIFFLCFFSLTEFNISSYDPLEDNRAKFRLPRPSNSDITISTPENKTYIEPMSGYYPATYGFENDVDGSNPENWEEASTSGPDCDVRVISSKFGHNKVLEGYDADYAGAFRINYYFNTTEGTIEFWMAQSTIAAYHAITTNIFNSTGIRLFGVRFLEHLIIIFTNTGQVTIATYNANTWYHIRFDFRSNSGNSYEGLNQNEFKFYLNDVLEGVYGFENIGDPDFLWCRSILDQGSGAYYGYWDAFGFSWDPDYNIGENLQEGLLLSFETEFTPEWLGYSLDGQTNKTVLGNTTLPFLNEGLHRLQVYSNDSLGTIYSSNPQYFLIDTILPQISIVSPIQDEFFGITPPDFQISFTELNLDSTWYYLGYGTNEVIFSGLTGTINQTEWDKLDSGEVLIRFYINDTGGLETFDQVWIQKDLIPPISSISYYPHDTPNKVNKSTTFSLSANDGIGSGVDIIRFKINTTMWFEYTGPFELSSYDYGFYLITYQAIDTVGNIESENTLLVSLVKIPSKEPEIPGFNPILILSLIGLVSLILMKRFKK
jgi:hypothetical protein